MAINVTTSKQQITASVAEDKISATVSGGFGATGPSGVINVTAPITNAGTTTAANVGLAVGTGLSVSGGSLVVTPDTYATLVGGKVPADQLPSYVDDVLEYANLASLPGTGESGKIYVALNTGKIYRWSGSAYFEISTQPGNTDAVPEGSTNLYFTNARARNSFGTGASGQVVRWDGSEWTAGTVPIASGSVVGGVRIGSGISIDGNGVISASAGYTLPQATNSTLGGITVSTGLSVASGALSVSYGTTSGTACQGDDARLSDARTPTAHNQAWSTITSTPTTLSGYGITDGVTTNDSRLTDARTPTSHSHGSITNAGAIGSTSGLVVTTGASGVLGTLAQGTAGQVLKVNSGATGVEWGAAAADVSIDTTAADILSATSGAISADDPGADRLVFWDDSAGKLTHLEVGTGLSISGTTITAAGAVTVTSPSQITANQNDYAGATADINRITSDAARDITGIAAGTDGQAILLVNVGSNSVTLKHQSTSSTAANRIIVPWAGDCVIPADGSAALVYDNTTARWRVI